MSEIPEWWSLFCPIGDWGQKGCMAEGPQGWEGGMVQGDCQQRHQLGLEWQETVCDWLLEGPGM